MRPLSYIKNLIFKKGIHKCIIQTGAFSGLKMNLDFATQTQYYVGTHEKEVHYWLKRFSKDAMVAIDVGMDQGEYALYFLAKTNVKKVFGFEPNSLSLDFFTKNLILNHLENSNRLIVSSKFVNEVDSIESTTLDSLVFEIDNPIVIKIDVDGGEMDVLRGAKKLLAIPNVRLIIETHSPELEIECLNFLSDSGYKTKVIKNAWWRCILPEMRGAGHRKIQHNRWLVAAKKCGIDI